ncbi:MAG: histidinol-phosphate transaminase [Clostridiaceae bacterium]
MENKEWKHGGDVYFRGKELVDFSSNINPLGVSQLVKDSAAELFAASEKYPDYEYRELKDSIIEYLRTYENIEISRERIILGNGASEILELAVSKVDSIGIAVPSFVEYEEFSVKHNKKTTYIPLNEDFQYDYEEILKVLEKCDGIILGNPNNPTGNLINKESFVKILDAAEKGNKKIIVDEAFVEFAGEGSSLVNNIKNYKCLVIVRAFTKFFGMPGARLGYGISGDVEYLNELRKNQLPWNINSFGELALKKSYKDDKYIKKSREWIKSEIRFIEDELRKIPLFDRVYHTNCNFILCRLKEINSQELYEKLFEKGILIRRCSNFRNLGDAYIRLAIKSRSMNNILINKLSEIYKEYSV